MYTKYFQEIMNFVNIVSSHVLAYMKLYVQLHVQRVAISIHDHERMTTHAYTYVRMCVKS